MATSRGEKCTGFTSSFGCACGLIYDDHQTVFETREERMAQGKRVDNLGDGGQGYVAMGGITCFSSLLDGIDRIAAGDPSIGPPPPEYASNYGRGPLKPDNPPAMMVQSYRALEQPESENYEEPRYSPEPSESDRARRPSPSQRAARRRHFGRRQSGSSSPSSDGSRPAPRKMNKLAMLRKRRSESSKSHTNSSGSDRTTQERRLQRRPREKKAERPSWDDGTGRPLVTITPMPGFEFDEEGTLVQQQPQPRRKKLSQADEMALYDKKYIKGSSKLSEYGRNAESSYNRRRSGPSAAETQMQVAMMSRDQKLTECQELNLYAAKYAKQKANRVVGPDAPLHAPKGPLRPWIAHEDPIIAQERLVSELQARLDDRSLSSAAHYAAKKKYRSENANLIRLRRKREHGLI